MVILRPLAASKTAVQQTGGKIFYTFRRILYNGWVMRIAALDTAATPPSTRHEFKVKIRHFIDGNDLLPVSGTSFQYTRVRNIMSN